jgi:hypothetical protein
MRKSILKISYFLLLAIFVISCGSRTKIEINFDQNQKGLLVFDQKDTLKIVGDSILTYEIESGNHTFVLNKEKPQTIDVSSNGGILNLNKKRYVRLYQKYGDETSFDIGIQPYLDIVVIDSMVYVYKKDSTAVVTDEQIKSSLENFSADTNSNSSLKLFNADLFVAKDWDYGLTEELPETISVQSNTSFTSIQYKTKLIEEYLFRISAILSPSVFVVKNKKDILENKGDKKVDEEKKKNQLDF